MAMMILMIMMTRIFFDGADDHDDFDDDNDGDDDDDEDDGDVLRHRRPTPMSERFCLMVFTKRTTSQSFPYIPAEPRRI